MFSATDKMANILKPLQLLEMKLGPTEIKYYEQNMNQVNSLKLIARKLLGRRFHFESYDLRTYLINFWLFLIIDLS